MEADSIFSPSSKVRRIFGRFVSERIYAVDCAFRAERGCPTRYRAGRRRVSSLRDG